MGADQSERPEPIGWEELLTRLAGRRHARVEGDAVTLWTTRSARLRTVLLSLLLGGLVAWPLVAGVERENQLGMALAGPLVFVAALVVAVRATRRAPLVRVDSAGIHVRTGFLPWADVRGWELRGSGRFVTLIVRVEDDSAAVAGLSSISRWLGLRHSAREVLRGVRFTVADLQDTCLRPEELRALVDHPGQRALEVADQERPRWEDRVARIAGLPGVHVDGHSLRFAPDGVERLRVDGEGVSGLQPDRWRSVKWDELEGLGMLSNGKQPAILLALNPSTAVDPPRGRLWRRLKLEQPVLSLPVRGLPFDAYEFALLLGSHPSGEAFWTRNHPR